MIIMTIFKLSVKRECELHLRTGPPTLMRSHELGSMFSVLVMMVDTRMVTMQLSCSQILVIYEQHINRRGPNSAKDWFK